MSIERIRWRDWDAVRLFGGDCELVVGGWVHPVPGARTRSLIRRPPAQAGCTAAETTHTPSS